MSTWILCTLNKTIFPHSDTVNRYKRFETFRLWSLGMAASFIHDCLLFANSFDQFEINKLLIANNRILDYSLEQSNFDQLQLICSIANKNRYSLN